MTAFVDILQPAKKTQGWIYNIACTVAGSCFLALIAQFSMHLWFTPVPITLQTLGVMLIGALLGSRKGAAAVLLYLGEGMLGFPVFAGGSAGIAALCGPTGGYLFAFVFSAFLIGFLLEKGWKNSYILTIFALCLGSAVTLGLGAMWLGLFVGIYNAFLLGVAPFLIGCGLQILVAAALIPSGWKLLAFFIPK